MNALVSLCLISAYAVFSVTAHIDRSTLEKSTVDVTARITHLKAHLPDSYRCCPDSYKLTETADIDVGYNVSCINEAGTTLDLPFNCTPMLVMDPSLENVADDIAMYVEEGALYVGDRNFYKYELNNDGVCLGNTTFEYSKLTGTGLALLVCFDRDTGYELVGIDAYTAAVLSLVSVPFLVLTIVVYAALPELRDLLGFSVLSLSSSLLVSCLVLATRMLEPPLNELCRTGGFLLYFSTMASLLWMSSIAHQQFVSVWSPKSASTWKEQFRWYCGYSWGVSAFLLVCVMITDIAPGHHLPPYMGKNSYCWFNGNAAKWAYYLGPLTVVMVCTSLLYAGTAVLIWRQSSSEQFHTQRYKWLFSLRLFVVVGIMRLNEPIQMIQQKNQLLWVLGDCWNLLQGVLLFVVLVLLRKRARGALAERAAPFRAWLRGRFSKSAPLVDSEAAAVISEDGDDPVETDGRNLRDDKVAWTFRGGLEGMFAEGAPLVVLEAAEARERVNGSVDAGIALVENE